MRSRQNLLGIASLVLAGLILAACTQVLPTHVATLEPTGTSTASGSATARLVGDDLTVEGTYQDLSGQPNSAEVYDETDSVQVFTLRIDSSSSGDFDGAGTLSGAQLDHLEAGNLSIRIFTDTYPETTTVGELEGNLTQN